MIVTNGELPPGYKDPSELKEDSLKPENLRKLTLIPHMIAVISVVHISALYGLYLCSSAKLYTILFSCLIYLLSELGALAGAHRLWSHRSYKAKLPLQILLMLFQSMAGQFTVFNWVRDHRLHHKYSDTDADPSNCKRGLFYAQIGWLMVKKNELVKLRGKEIDISDVLNNPVLRFQNKHPILTIGGLCYVFPTLVPVYFWGESLNIAWHVNALRYVLSMHAAFSINSLAHKWGSKPYDTRIDPTTNVVISALTLGEGFHNFHHTFPWDYRNAELSNNKVNLSALFIDFCAAIGWAYDLKTVSEEMARNRAVKTGDGSDAWGRLSK